MSIEGGGGRERRKSDSPREALLPLERSSTMLEASDAARIARGLTEKYGVDALSFAQDRAQRAIEVGDDLALDAWRAVIKATQALLRRMADA
jgi:hypothetical protein